MLGRCGTLGTMNRYSQEEKIQEYPEEKLIKAYELMYKYGWIVNYLSTGYLRDAVLRKVHAVYEELDNELDYGIWILKDAISTWIDEHQPLEPTVDTSNPLNGIFPNMNLSDVVPYVTTWAYEKIGRETAIGLTPAQDFLMAAPYFVGDPEMDAEEAFSIIQKNKQENEFKTWISLQTDLFDLENVLFLASQQMNVGGLLPFVEKTLAKNSSEFYSYVESTPLESGLVDTARRVLSILENCPNSLEDKIAAFNAGLNLSHYNGEMAEHMGISQQLLNALSNGEYNSKWDADLRKMGIKGKRIRSMILYLKDFLESLERFSAAIGSEIDESLLIERLDELYYGRDNAEFCAALSVVLSTQVEEMTRADLRDIDLVKGATYLLDNGQKIAAIGVAGDVRWMAGAYPAESFLSQAARRTKCRVCAS